jgi:hypothetical protein
MININNCNSCGHKLYGTNRSGTYNFNIFFAHRNPLLNQNDYEYYTRTVNRFVNILSSQNRTLFIHMITRGTSSYYGNNNPTDYINKTIELYNCLKNKCNNFELIVICNDIGDSHGYNIINEIGNTQKLTIYNFITSSGSNAFTYSNEVDNMNLYDLITNHRLFDFDNDEIIL